MKANRTEVDRAVRALSVSGRANEAQGRQNRAREYAKIRYLTFSRSKHVTANISIAALESKSARVNRRDKSILP